MEGRSNAEPMSFAIPVLRALRNDCDKAVAEARRKVLMVMMYLMPIHSIR